MASRSHVESKVNSEVAERRLRPIYDCLDNGNNKKALQEADKALKKQKDFQCAKVLKALALLRLGRQDESSTLLEEVHKQHPTEDSTLNAMAICYREIHKLDLIADMYENANKSRPGNEEILTHLFMAYVRLGHYKKQQQTAMALHKVQPQKNPYCFWAIMSIVMQAQHSPDLAKKMFLPLAERMTKKFVDEDKIEAEAEVQMYLIILEHSEKYEEALEVLQGPLAAKLMSELDFKETKMAELYTRMKNWQKSNIAYKQLLRKNPDHIGWWKEYIRSTIELATSTKHLDIMVNSEVEADDTLEKALSFIESCHSGLEDRYQSRGPFLAQLELIKQCQHAGNKWTEYGNPVELLDGYYEMFGDKFCCFSDIQTYLEILNESEQTKLADILLSKNKYAHADGSLIFVDNVKQMQRHITSLQLRQCLGCYGNLSREEKYSLAHELVQRHKQGIHFGTELLTTDLQYCDSYLLLAVALLLDIMHTNGDRRLVWECIILLEQGLVHSPSSSQIKLLLIRLYCSVGAFGPCPNLYDSMEIKHIMNDTLGYIVSSHVGRLGHFMAACSVYGTMLRFFTVNHKETAEYLIASYKYGSFTKILEFVQFRERLQSSLQFASAGVERKLLDIILDTSSHTTTEQMVMYMEIDPANIKTCYDRLRDNRDLSVVLCWDPASSYDIAALQQQSLKEELAWLKVRDLMLHILAGCVKLGQEIDHDHQTKNGIASDGPVPLHLMLSDLQTQLSNHIEACRQCYSQEIKYPIQGPFRTRLSTYLRGGYSSMFLEMHSNVLYVQSLSDIDLEKIEESKEEILKSKVPTIAEELMQQYPCVLLLEDGDRKSIDPMVLEHTVLLAESLSHMCVMAGVCYRLLKPVKTVLARRNKKKKDNPIPMPPTFENFNGLVAGLERVCQSLHRSASSLDPVYLGLDLSSLSLAEHVPGDQEKDVSAEVWKKVEGGYQQSVLEITELLHKKLQYLGGLHL